MPKVKSSLPKPALVLPADLREWTSAKAKKLRTRFTPKQLLKKMRQRTKEYFKTYQELKTILTFSNAVSLYIVTPDSYQEADDAVHYLKVYARNIFAYAKALDKFHTEAGIDFKKYQKHNTEAIAKSLKLLKRQSESIPELIEKRARGEGLSEVEQKLVERLDSLPEIEKHLEKVKALTPEEKAENRRIYQEKLEACKKKDAELLAEKNDTSTPEKAIEELTGVAPKNLHAYQVLAAWFSGGTDLYSFFDGNPTFYTGSALKNLLSYLQERRDELEPPRNWEGKTKESWIAWRWKEWELFLTWVKKHWDNPSTMAWVDYKGVHFTGASL